MKKLSFLLLLLAVFSCNQQSATIEKSTSNENKVYEAGISPLETLKTIYSTYGDIKNTCDLSSWFFKANYKEILNSLEIVETVEFVDEDDFTNYISFYKYYIGTRLIRDVEFFMLENGKYYRVYTYLSTYKVSREEKELAERIEDWETKNIYKSYE